ncbi:PepSY domain-containing protein [Alsobacter sp. KACC 23698]|uniref:PepSY domain-containing protein n=1 Tax=Alsobacter sp. KACC 23698 TaxID=3149229 RepID=A0AAU7JFY5_9HYPH
MRTILITIFATVAAASMALAGESKSAAGDAIRQHLENLGYRVSHLEVEHGRLMLRAVNDTGLPIKLTYDPATREMLRAALR